MIETLAPDEARDAVSHAKVLLCFASCEDLKLPERMLVNYSNIRSTRLIRVEPTVEAAQTFQISRFPTFVLYEYGNETFQALGIDTLDDKIRLMLR